MKRKMKLLAWFLVCVLFFETVASEMVFATNERVQVEVTESMVESDSGASNETPEGYVPQNVYLEQPALEVLLYLVPAMQDGQMEN